MCGDREKPKHVHYHVTTPLQSIKRKIQPVHQRPFFQHLFFPISLQLRYIPTCGHVAIWKPQQESATGAEMGVATHRPFNQSAFPAAKCNISADANSNVSGNSSAGKPLPFASSVKIEPGCIANARTFGCSVPTLRQDSEHSKEEAYLWE